MTHEKMIYKSNENRWFQIDLNQNYKSQEMI